MVAASTSAFTDTYRTIRRQDLPDENSSTTNVDDKQQVKRGLDGAFKHYGSHEEKIVTIVKKVPVPIEITKHVPVPVEKIIPVPIKVDVIRPFPVIRHV